MDILRIIIASIVTATLLMGCDNKSTIAPDNSSTTQQLTNNMRMLLPQPNIGDTKEYWIQTYSTLFNKTNIEQRMGTKALVSYQVKDVNSNQIDINVKVNHIELLIRDRGYPS